MPFALVRALTAAPVDGVATTRALGTAAPDGSVTRPVSALEASCPRATPATANNRKKQKHFTVRLMAKLMHSSSRKSFLIDGLRASRCCAFAATGAETPWRKNHFGRGFGRRLQNWLDSTEQGDDGAGSG